MDTSSTEDVLSALLMVIIRNAGFLDKSHIFTEETLKVLRIYNPLGK